MSPCYSTRKVISQDVCRNTRPDAPWALFHILWHCGRQRVSATHTHTVHRQDQGQLPASIFIIFILSDLLHPSWRHWSQPSPCDASALHTCTHIHTHAPVHSAVTPCIIENSCCKVPLLLTLYPSLTLLLLLHLPFWLKAIPKPSSPPFPFSCLTHPPPIPPPTCLRVCLLSVVVLIDKLVWFCFCSALLFLSSLIDDASQGKKCCCFFVVFFSWGWIPKQIF